MVFVTDFDSGIAEFESLDRLAFFVGAEFVAADDAVGEFVGHKLFHLGGTGAGEGDDGFLAGGAGEEFLEQRRHGAVRLLGDLDRGEVGFSGFAVG